MPQMRLIHRTRPQGLAWAFANVSNPWVRVWRLIPFWTWMQVTPRKKSHFIRPSELPITLIFWGCHLSCKFHLTSPGNPFSLFPKWLFSPLSTQFADVYNIPHLIIKEDHLGERNTSLLLQSVQDRAGGTTLASELLQPLCSSLFLLIPLSSRTSQSVWPCCLDRFPDEQSIAQGQRAPVAVWPL